MREFDIDKIGKRMPYDAPSEEFFTQFKERMERETAKSRGGFRRLIPIIAAAATLLLGLFVYDLAQHQVDDGYNVSESIDQSIDDYFSNLSDEELNTLMAGAASSDDFYLTLY